MPRGGSLRLAMINRPAPSKPKRRPSSEARRPLPGQGQSPSSLSSGNIDVFSGLVEADDAALSSQHKLGIFSSRRNTHTEMIERELEGLARLLRLPRKLPGQSVEWYGLNTNAASVEAMRRTEKHSKISGARAASLSHREWYVPSGDLGKRHIVPWKTEDPSSFGTGPHRPGKGTAKKLPHRQRKEGAIQC